MLFSRLNVCAYRVVRIAFTHTLLMSEFFEAYLEHLNIVHLDRGPVDPLGDETASRMNYGGDSEKV
jgi:hypothetical protein